jgi:hypothetical protein
LDKAPESYLPQAVADAALAAGLGRLHAAVPAERGRLSRRVPVEWLCLYDHGLAYQPERGEPVAVRWAEVEQIRRLDERRYRKGIPDGIEHRTELRLPGGHQLWLTDRFPHAESLTRHIVTRVTEARVPLLASAIRAGAVVDFGPLSLYASGIGHDGGHLDWVDVAAVGIYKGSVKIVGRGLRKARVSVPAHGLPNLALLLALAKRVRAGS